MSLLPHHIVLHYYSEWYAFLVAAYQIYLGKEVIIQMLLFNR